MAKKRSTAVPSRAGSVVFIGNADDKPGEFPTTEVPETVVPHPEFFLDNTLIAIQIEKTLYNVHKYQLTKSEFFSRVFKEPRDEDEPEVGSSPKDPLIIKGISASDFSDLLNVLYASHFSKSQYVPETHLIIPAFRIATALTFSELLSFLLPFAQQNLCDVDKILFAREFDINEWLEPAHVHLCERKTPLSTEEARKLGVDSVLIIWRMREQYRSISFPIDQNYCGSCAGWDYTGSNNTCSGCGGGSARLRCQGKGIVAKMDKLVADGPLIRKAVNKWIKDDFVIKP